MAYFSETGYGEDGRWISGAIGTTRTGGGMFSWQNPEEGAVVVDKVYLDITTAATSSVCTFDIGYTATSASTSSDTIIDGGDPSTTARVYNHLKDAGTNGVYAARVAKGKWVTASEITGDVTGIVGKYYLHYRKVRP